MPDELLKETLETDAVALTSVRGPKSPTVDTEVTYTCVVKPRRNLRNLTVDFGFFESPGDFGYAVSRFHPEAESREPGTITFGLAPAYGIKACRGRVSVQRYEERVIWHFRKMRAEETQKCVIHVSFNSEVPSPRGSCVSKKFRLRLEVSTKQGFLFGRSTTYLAADVSKVSLIPIVPCTEQVKEAIRFKSEYGRLYLGGIRQVSFRAESIGYFVEQLREAETDDAQFVARIRAATRKIAATWVDEVQRTNVLRDVTVSAWAAYDSWAGLGQISCERRGPDKYEIEVIDPFTERWGVPKEVRELFWDGYVRGILEGITAVKIATTHIKTSTEGNTTKLTINVQFDRTP